MGKNKIVTQLQIFDYKLSSSYKFSGNTKNLINTINPHSFVIAKSDVEFSNALKSSDILLPDGIGIVWAVKLLTGKRIKKIAGSDIHFHLLNKANIEKLRVFYMGSSEKTLAKIKEKISTNYPNIKSGVYSPPFKEYFSHEENRRMINMVNKFKPDILFVGMTAPKQEKWAFANKDHLAATTICCIGAVFDFYAGTVKRPPKWVIKIGLEWLGRFIKEPSRMWRRNFISTPIFIFDVLKEKFKQVFKK